ncbi:MAG TPA: Ig-like domain-containing protein, partial [Nitrososphaeraceae archaeon]|nr:Ig-like domain-containing protein [Nitrososphaeraceae archaeon]
MIFEKFTTCKGTNNFNLLLLLFCWVVLFFSASISNEKIINNANAQAGYQYAPGLVLTGSNYQDTASSTALRPSQFSVAVWFKTSSNFGSDAFIVNKGGIGSDSSGQNLNYGIWMNSGEQIKAGFETSSGSDQYVTSPGTYNNGQWHYVVVTNDGSTVRLYIDGTQVATKSTSGASPETSGTKPVRVGANSRVTPPGNFFTGEVDEVRVWNDDLTTQQVADAFAGTSFNTGEQVLYLPFGSNSPPVANNQNIVVTMNTAKSVTLVGTDSNNDPLQYTIVTQPSHGTITGGTTASRTYTPATDYVGSDSFTFKVNDGTVDSNTATVSITVEGLSNSPPMANNQDVTVNKNTPQAITLTATDPNGDPLSYTVVTQPAHGTITGGTTASRTYTPATDYVGSDSFTFKVNDGTVDSNTATVSITVQQTTPTGSYNYSPGLSLTGSNYQDTASSTALRPSQFSVAVWFKTSSNFGSDAFIVNKGGVGSDSSGQNLNYGIWMNSGEQIKAGFETSSGSDQYVTSPGTYNNG